MSVINKDAFFIKIYSTNKCIEMWKYRNKIIWKNKWNLFKYLKKIMLNNKLFTNCSLSLFLFNNY